MAKFDVVFADRTDSPGELVDGAGTWKFQTPGANGAVSRGKGWAVYSKSGNGTGVAVLGREDWEDFVYGADFKLVGSEQAGLVFGHVDDKNYEALLYSTGAVRHVRVRDGKAQVVAEKPARVDARNWHRLKHDADRRLAPL